MWGKGGELKQCVCNGMIEGGDKQTCRKRKEKNYHKCIIFYLQREKEIESDSLGEGFEED